MCVVKVFCCGCSLREGAITVAVLHAVEAFIVISCMLIVLQVNLVIAIFALIKLAPTLVTFICLVVGITKSVTCCMVSGIMMYGINFVFTCILIILALFYISSLYYVVVIAPMGLLYMAFNIYLLIVIHSYDRELYDAPPPYTPEVKA